MSIIAISRELASLGDETAHELAKILNCHIVDKRNLEDRIKSYGAADKKLVKYDEIKPSFLSTLSHNKDDYFHYLRTAVLTGARQGNCIFLGRGAGTMLKNVPGVFSVFLAAPMEIRLERVRSYFHCDEHRARQIIQKSDHERKGFYHYFFDTEWKDAGNYHMALNTGHLHPEVCAEIVKNMMDRIITGQAQAQSAARIIDLSLEQAIKHTILYEKEISIHFLEIAISGEKVSLFGVAGSQALVEAALEAARETAGPDALVNSEIQVVNEYTLVP